MRIGMIFTGGTIGSTIDGSGYIGPREGTPFALLQLYKERFGDEVEFVEREPYRILSENLNAENLLQLVATIRTMLMKEEVQGIIVTHGTDTLQYGSAVLGYLFGNASVPIVVVSSNYVLEDSRANGFTNFRYAVEFVKGNYGKGVFVSYCNVGGVPTIHRATRLQPLVPLSDHVSSVRDTWYGKFKDGIYMENAEYTIKEGQPALLERMENVKLKSISDEIMWIRPYVGMTYPVPDLKTKVILHGSYHSGTICVDDRLKAFALKAKDMGIPFYLTGVEAGVKGYETVKAYNEYGITPLYTSAEVAQYCKLWLALSNGMHIDAVMNTCIAEDWV